jgi:hypothetical protein
MFAASLVLALLVPDERALSFAAVRRGPAVVVMTPAQPVFLEDAGGSGRGEWSATSSQSWVTVSPTTGRGPARLTISLSTNPPAGSAAAEVRIVFADGSADAVIAVRATGILDRSAPPTGFVDAPEDGFVGEDHVRLSGWALDDVAVARIEICAERSPFGGERPCTGGVGALLGTAAAHAGRRPDVAGSFPATPINARSAWSFVLGYEALPPGRRGTTRIAVQAFDEEGQGTIIGRRTVTVTPAPPRAAAVQRNAAIVLLVLLGLHTIVRAVLPRACDTSGVVSERQPILRREIAALAAALVLAGLADVHGLRRGFSYDELFCASHFIAGQPLAVAATRTVTFNNHYGFSLVSAAASRGLGTSEAAIRLPAVLLALWAIAVSWAFTRKVWGRTAAAAAALLLAVLPGFVDWSHSARGYSGLTLAAVASILFFTIAVRTGSRRAAAWHGISLAAGLYFHLYAVWIAAIQYALFLFLAASARIRCNGQWRLHPLWWSFGAAGLGAFLLYLPMLPDLVVLMAAQQRTISVAQDFPQYLVAEYLGQTPLVAVIVFGILIAIGIWRALQSLEGTLVVATMLVPALAVWLLVRPANLHPRFVAFALPLIACLAGAGVACRSSGGVHLRQLETGRRVPLSRRVDRGVRRRAKYRRRSGRRDVRLLSRPAGDELAFSRGTGRPDAPGVAAHRALPRRVVERRGTAEGGRVAAPQVRRDPFRSRRPVHLRMTCSPRPWTRRRGVHSHLRGRSDPRHENPLAHAIAAWQPRHSSSAS